MRKSYDIEALKLVKAIEIAIESYTSYPPEFFTKENIEQTVGIHQDWKNSILNRESKFRNMASLKYDIQNVFTFFQEGHGRTVEFFWERLAKEDLGYQREDKLRKIIENNKIKNLIEYNLVIDSILAAEQLGRITRTESIQLSNLIGEFESRKKK